MNQISGLALTGVEEFLRTYPPFEFLPDNLLAFLVNKLEISYFTNHSTFEDLPHGLRIIRSGAAEVKGENDLLIDRLEEGDSFNQKGLMDSNPLIKIKLIEDSLIYFLPQDTYLEIRRLDRNFDRHFQNQRSKRLRRATRYEVNPQGMLEKISAKMNRNLVTVNKNMTIQNCARVMSEKRVSSLLIVESETTDQPQESNGLIGIITDRDIRSRVVAQNLPLQTKVSEIMTTSPKTIMESDTLFSATIKMLKHRIHHLPVIKDAKLEKPAVQNESSEQLTHNSSRNLTSKSIPKLIPIGMITTSDLMLQNKNDPVFIVQHIYRQQNPEGIANILNHIPELLNQSLATGLKVNMASEILTAISDAVTIRLIELYQIKHGEPPVEFCWLGFGSQGRKEQLLNPDQDNGLLISDDLQDSDQNWFEGLASFVCDGLNYCGYVYCPGDIMATNNTWRQTLSVWQSYIDHWTQTPTPKAVMHTTIFFDLRCIYGNKKLFHRLQSKMIETASQNTIYLAAMAANTLESDPPLGVFRRFLVERNGKHANELDLKKRGILPIIDMVRLLSISNKVFAVSTIDRLNHLAAQKLLSMEDARNLQDALAVILQLRLNHQINQRNNHQKVSNYINPNELPQFSKRQLKDAFAVIKDAMASIQRHYDIVS